MLAVSTYFLRKNSGVLFLFPVNRGGDGKFLDSPETQKFVIFKVLKFETNQSRIQKNRVRICPETI